MEGLVQVRENAVCSPFNKKGQYDGGEFATPGGLRDSKKYEEAGRFLKLIFHLGKTSAPKILLELMNNNIFDASKKLAMK